MTDKDREDYILLIGLYDTLVNQLIETLQRMMECEELPCLKLAAEVAARRAEILEKENHEQF
jgi:hypothetical protein